jgi:predicted neuraminidase
MSSTRPIQVNGPNARVLAAAAMAAASALLILLLFYRMAPDDRPWAFVVNVPKTPVRGTLDIAIKTLTPPTEDHFVHAPSLVATPTGLLAFWYRAIYEGANDAQIMSASFDGSKWSKPTAITDSERIGRDIGLTVKSLANPVPFRRSANEIWLFVTTSRLSGWATSEILLMRSYDNGKTWGPAKRLFTSPFVNISMLTKSPPVLLSDGRIGLPAYAEFYNMFPVMLVLDESGRVIDRRRMGDGGQVGIQPSIVVTGKTTAVALIRRLRTSSRRRALVSRTSDGGKTWSVPEPTNLPNPSGPLSAVRYDSSHILMAFNDDPRTESNVSLAISDLEGVRWRRVGPVAVVSKQAPDNRAMYPYLIQSAPGQYDVVFSRSRDAIDHVRVSSSWIERNQPILSAGQ